MKICNLKVENNLFISPINKIKSRNVGILTINGTSTPEYTNTTDYIKLINGTNPINNPVVVTIL